MKFSFYGCIVLLVFLQFGCSGSDSTTTNPGQTIPNLPINIENLNFTYSLSQSTRGLLIWTQPKMKTLGPQDSPPAAQESELLITAAKHEHEDILLVFGPGTGNISVSTQEFPNLSNIQQRNWYRVGYTQNVADTLSEQSENQSINLNATDNTALLLSLYIPEDAASGMHTTQISVFHNGAEVVIPLNLYVHDFSLSKNLNFTAQLNVGISGLIPQGGSGQDAYDLLFEHRITPKTTTWPSGFHWNITWDNPSAPSQCAAFYDEANESPDFGIRYLAERYLHGINWNNVGFAESTILSFVSNAQTRPSTFCGEILGTAAYDTEWSNYLSALNTYLVDNSYANKTHFLVMNEPQNGADYDEAASLCSLYKSAAPNLRLAISKQPIVEIAENNTNPCGYDIWIAHTGLYEQNYAWNRQNNFQESVWLYSIDQDPEPYFNPTQLGAGIDQRIIPWVAWHQRIVGWSYYNDASYFVNGLPTLKTKILRDSLEDYEYLLASNAGNHPVVNQTQAVDETVNSLAKSLVNWERDPEALLKTRLQLGFYVENLLNDAPIHSYNGNRPKGNYNINFQDPAGNPVAQPLIVDNDEYIKVGWQDWSETLGYGWYGDALQGNTKLSGYQDVQGASEVDKSFIYDDFGNINVFEFALENGTYEVTVAVGRPNSTLAAYQNVTVEGIPVIDEVNTFDMGTPLVSSTQTIVLKDGKLSFEVGGRSRVSNNKELTLLNHIKIRSID